MTSLFSRKCTGAARRTQTLKARCLRRARLNLEALDARILPSVSTDLSQGILSITADDNPNQVQVSQPAPDQVLVTESGQAVGTFPADQVQLIVFQYGAADSTFDNQTLIPGKELRLFNSPRLTPDQLNQTGTLDALLVGDTLTLSGPSGAGFQLVGNWTATTYEGDLVHHTFTASGNVTLPTPLGDLAFTSPDDDPLTITTIGIVEADFGAVDGLTWTTDQVLNTADPANPLSAFGTVFGLQLDTGEARLGVQVGANLTGLGAPLNNALPYIYVTTTTANTAQFGEIVANVGDGNPLTVVLDPRDPFLYARAGEFTAGASFTGYIPYVRAQILPELNDPHYGHLYGVGSVSLGDLPVALTGAAVFNLDAANDGQLLAALQGDVASQLVTGVTALSDFAQNAPQDLQVGFNGSMGLGYSAAGFDLNLAADGSAQYAPGLIVVHGISPNPFAGTPLSFITPLTPVDLTASYDGQGDMDIAATTARAMFGSLPASNLHVAFNIQGVALDVHMDDLPGLGPVDMHGSIQATGQYTFTGTVQTVLAGFRFDGTFTLSNVGLMLAGQVTVPGLVVVAMTGNVSANGSFNLAGVGTITLAGFSLPNTAFSLSTSGMTATTRLSTSLATVDLSGVVRSDGQAQLAGVANVVIDGYQTTANFVLTNTQLTVSLTLSIPSVGMVPFSGTIDPRGNFRLTGMADFTVAGFRVAGGAFVLTNSGLSVSGTVTIPGVATLTMSGTVASGGQISLAGTANGFTLAGYAITNAVFSLNNTGMVVSAQANVPPLGQFVLTGTVNAQGQFTLTTSLGFTIAGYTGIANLTLNNSGLMGQFFLNFGVLGARVMLTGRVNPNGSFSLDGTNQVSLNTGRFGSVLVDLTFHWDNVSGFRTHAAGSFNWTMGTSTLQGSFALDLSVAPGGFFSSSGTFTALLTVNGRSMTVGVNYNIDNHNFIIHAPAPFGDVSMHY